MKLSREEQIAKTVADLTNEMNHGGCPGCGNDRSVEPVKEWITNYHDCALCLKYVRAARKNKRAVRKHLREHPLDVEAIARSLGITL